MGLPATTDDANVTPPSPTRHYTKATAAAAIDQIETAIGGRAGLVTALLHVGTADPLMEIVGIIADPANDARKLSQICADYKIGVGDLLEAYKRGRLALVQIEAIHVAANGVIPVVSDVMRRAAPFDETCADCRGTTTRPGKKPDDAPVPCEACGGTGKIRQLPELNRQKFAMSLAGMGEAGNVPAVSVNVTQQTAVKGGDVHVGAGRAGASANLGFDALTAASDKILFGGAKSPIVQTQLDDVVDAVVEPDDDDDHDGRGAR